MQIEFNWNSIEKENGEKLLKSVLKKGGKDEVSNYWNFWKKME
jgi:hypothetical protein